VDVSGECADPDATKATIGMKNIAGMMNVSVIMATMVVTLTIEKVAERTV
jgi:hypothetical protein